MGLPPERTGTPAPPNLVALRGQIAQFMAASVPPGDPPRDESSIAGVRALRFNPPVPSRGTVLHLHGGAFRTGAPEVVARYAAALAVRCGVTVVCPAYRLAPDNPFPAGLADSWAVLRALHKERAGPLLVAGDSAGGGLAAGVAMLAASNDMSLAGLALLSPWLDLTVTSDGYADNAASDPLFSADAARTAASLYLQGLSSADPLASPLFGKVEGLPPTLIVVGAGEVLLDDACRFHARLRAADVASRLDVVPGMEHVAVVRDLALPGATRTFDALADFVTATPGERAA